jgi:hypothetical protein
LIDKWQQESRIVQANFVDAENSKEFSCTIAGLIREVAPSELRIHTGMQLRRGDFLGCVLGLHRARFELLDSRNFPAGEEELKLAIEQAYEYILVVRFLSGAGCELYVFKEGTQETDIFRGYHLR